MLGATQESAKWEIDRECTNFDFEHNDGIPYSLWQCCACSPHESPGRFSNLSTVVASLSGIDFGRDGEPWGDPYKRIVEAELALESLSK